MGNAFSLLPLSDLPFAGPTNGTISQRLLRLLQRRPKIGDFAANPRLGTEETNHNIKDAR